MGSKKHSGHDPFEDRERQKYDDPIASREYILQVLAEIGRPAKRSEIAELLKIHTEEKMVALRRRLKAMLRDDQVTLIKGAYGLAQMLESLTGIVSMANNGYAYVRAAAKADNVLLSPKDSFRVWRGDEVQVHILREDHHGKLHGTLTRIIHAVTPELVGLVQKSLEGVFVMPLHSPKKEFIKIEDTRGIEYTHGEYVVVRLHRSSTHFPLNEGTIVKKLSHNRVADIAIEVISRNYDLTNEWPKALEDLIQKWEHNPPQPVHAQWVDLTHLPFVTIDGEDARDFDDAVYAEPRKEGGWKLYVAIADVSAYVRDGSVLDKAARERGNSVYFPGTVYPMLPEILSNDLCSLRPHEDRLTLTCEMVIDEQGRLTRAKFSRARIHSKARLTYTQVARAIEGEPHVRQSLGPIWKQIDDLHAVYRQLHMQREQRGAIDFHSFETRILFDEQGKVSEIVPSERTVAHRLIEECMLLANVSAAQFLKKNKSPTLYRNHLGPADTKLTDLQRFLGERGLFLEGGKEPSPKDYNKLLRSIEGRPDTAVIESVMLRSLSQACYESKNEGHFGLAYKAYVHFTSPIRRYPDLLVHRAICALVEGRQVDPTPEENARIQALGEHCSMTERRADEASRDVVMHLKCTYLQDRLMETFEGTITSVTHFGFFVAINSLYVDGLVHITSLANDYYEFDSISHQLRGERTGQTYTLGDVVQVRLVRVDIDDRKIDFVIATEDDDIEALKRVNVNKRPQAAKKPFPESKKNPTKKEKKKRPERPKRSKKRK